MTLRPPRNVDQDGTRFHYLKCWLFPFHDVETERKTFEYRKHDRDFRVGDVLVLEEYNDREGILTNRAIEREVTYLLPGGTFGVPDGYCVMGIAPWRQAAQMPSKAEPKDEPSQLDEAFVEEWFSLHPTMQATRAGMRVLLARHSGRIRRQFRTKECVIAECKNDDAGEYALCPEHLGTLIDMSGRDDSIKVVIGTTPGVESLTAEQVRARGYPSFAGKPCIHVVTEHPTAQLVDDMLDLALAAEPSSGDEVAEPKETDQAVKP